MRPRTLFSAFSGSAGVALIILSGCQGASAPVAGDNGPKKAPINKPNPTPVAQPTAAEGPVVEVGKLIGKPAPAFTLQLLSGKSVTSAELKGHVVLLDFWATWCKSCVGASPTIQKIFEKYSSKGVRVIGVNCMESIVSEKKLTPAQMITESFAKASNYAKEHGYSYEFAVYGDPITTNWTIAGLPAFIILDQNGNVVEFKMDAKPETLAGLDAAIGILLGG